MSHLLPASYQLWSFVFCFFLSYPQKQERMINTLPTCPHAWLRQCKRLRHGCVQTHVTTDCLCFGRYHKMTSSPSLSASHTHTSTHRHFSTLSHSRSLHPVSPPTYTEVCVQTDYSKMAAVQPTGFSCAACCSAKRQEQCSLKAQATKERCMCWV